MGKARRTRPPLKTEVEEAQRRARSAAEAARILGVCYNTYKKWAKAYGVFENLINQPGIGISKGGNIRKGRYALEDLLKGMYPTYPVKKLQARIIKNGYLAEECAVCGFNEKRITDYKVPLKLNHLNGDITDHRFENIELLCFNCWFLTVGNLWGQSPKGMKR